MASKTIKVSEDTHARLDLYRGKGETFEAVINRFINGHVDNQLTVAQFMQTPEYQKWKVDHAKPD